MSDLTIYLDKTTKTQFNDWLFVYGNNKRNNTYTFDKTRYYSLSFPVSKFDNLNQLSLDALVTEPISLVKVDEDHDISSYNDFEQKDVLKITWLEIGERLKVTVSHISVLRYLQPVLELLSALAQDWQEARRDVLEYVQAQVTRYGVTIDTSHFPTDTNTAQVTPLNITKDSQRYYIAHPQGGTIEASGKINEGYALALLPYENGSNVKPYNAGNLPVAGVIDKSDTPIIGVGKPNKKGKIFLANKALWKEIGFFYRSSEYKTAKQGIEHMRKKHPKFKKSEKTMDKIIKEGLSGVYD